MAFSLALTSFLQRKRPGAPTSPHHYLIGTFQLVLWDALGHPELCQLVLAEHEVLLQPIVHVLLPLQLLLAVLVLLLHCLKLALHRRVLGQGGGPPSPRAAAAPSPLRQ